MVCEGFSAPGVVGLLLPRCARPCTGAQCARRVCAAQGLLVTQTRQEA